MEGSEAVTRLEARTSSSTWRGGSQGAHKCHALGFTSSEQDYACAIDPWDRMRRVSLKRVEREADAATSPVCLGQTRGRLRVRVPSNENLKVARAIHLHYFPASAVARARSDSIAAEPSKGNFMMAPGTTGLQLKFTASLII